MSGSKTFGKKLKAFRSKTGMTQPQLAEASGVATSIVNDIENGIRTAGIKTLDKIAHGLKLPEEDRFVFLLAGLRLSKRDFLIPDFGDYPPEILNFLPYALRRSGIKSSGRRRDRLARAKKQKPASPTQIGKKLFLWKSGWLQENRPIRNA